MPVAAPFVYVLADVVKPKSIRLRLRNRLGSGLPAARISRARFRGIVSPGKLLAFYSAPGGSLPFSFGGQTVVAVGHAAQPFAVIDSLKPCDSDHRLLRVIEIRIIPEGWDWSLRRLQEALIFRIGDLAAREAKFVDPDAMNRALVLLPKF